MYNNISGKETEHNNGARRERRYTVVDMGMTDKQFNGFVRFILDDLRELEELEEKNEPGKLEKLRKLIENLQKTLED